MFSGNQPVIHKYQIGEAMAVAGVPVLHEVLANNHGLVLCSTTAAANTVGVTLDAQGTRNTAQQTGNADPSVFVTVNVSPGAVYRADLSGGSTSGTALSAVSNTAASTDGLTLTSSLGTAYDDGYVWGATGANVGLPSLRKVYAVDGSTATFVVAQRYDIAVGDTFYAATFGPAADAGIQLTTTLEEIDATGDNQGTDNLRCVFLHAKDASEVANGQRSWAEIVLFDHVFSGNIT